MNQFLFILSIEESVQFITAMMGGLFYDRIPENIFWNTQKHNIMIKLNIRYGKIEKIVQRLKQNNQCSCCVRVYFNMFFGHKYFYEFSKFMLHVGTEQRAPLF